MSAESQSIESLSSLIEGEAQSLRAVRHEALRLVTDQGWPSNREESFRFTKLKEFTKQHFGQNLDEHAASSNVVDDPWLHITESHIHYVNGQQIKNGVDVQGVKVDDWRAIRQHGMLPEQSAFAQSNVFRALNTALLQAGPVIDVAANTKLVAPILLHYVQDHDGKISRHPKVTLKIGAGAQVHFIERYESRNQDSAWTNSVVDIELQPGAQLTHTLVVEEGQQQFHFRDTQIDVQKDANYKFLVFNLSGKQFRQQCDISLSGTHAHTEIHALMLGQSSEQIENQLCIRHVAESCTSRQWVRGIFDDQSHGVFTGRVVVGKGAQKTDAGQSNKNLLLSDNARVNAMPQLEIYADDVKCQHGATTGSLDLDSLFYLMARGIPRHQARQMLIRAFAHEIADQIEQPFVRNHIERAIDARFAGQEPK